MGDKFEIKEGLQVDPDKLESARAYNRKLQVMGRNLLNSLFMLVRNVKLYDPDNAIFRNPIDKCVEIFNTIISSEGNIDIQTAGDAFYLNNMLLRVDLQAVDNVKYLSQEFQRCNVGGFVLDQHVTAAEMRNFIFIFSKENKEEAGEQGVPARKLMALKLRRFEKLEEILQRQKDIEREGQPDDAKLDRKRYAFVIYARLIHFLRRFVAGMRGDGARLAMSKSRHFIQDLVDVIHGHHSQFLGLTTMRGDEDALCFHLANVTALALVFGSELGLSKEQLRELGQVALFHDIGMSVLDDRTLSENELYSDPNKALVRRTDRYTVLEYLRNRPIQKASLHGMIVARDYRQDYGKSLTGLDGNVSMVECSSDLSLYTKIVAISDCFEVLTSRKALNPDIAYELMNSEMKHRFDPDLLKLFGKTIAGYASRVLAETGQRVEVF
ncbi:MAG: hypothetical protein JXR96_08570 [Deltaproteobacteria bacterium]|nr:hypothetical protein [Deltaproteobacteria bacterium]